MSHSFEVKKEMRDRIPGNLVSGPASHSAGVDLLEKASDTRRKSERKYFWRCLQQEEKNRWKRCSLQKLLQTRSLSNRLFLKKEVGKKNDS